MPLARIRFLSASEGGRAEPSHGTRWYTTICRLPWESAGCPGQWSLVVSLPFIDVAGTHMTFVHFLSADAPHDLLLPGVQFDLYEGHRLVASGEIMPE